MSQADISKWNNKYLTADITDQAVPDEELIRHTSAFPEGAHALDLACGLGKNTLYLARKGFDVLAVDGSSVGLAHLDEAAKALGVAANIHTQQADLDEYHPGEAKFDLIVVVRYLNRALFPMIQLALKPGGILLYKTFNHNVLKSRPAFNVDFTITPEALLDAFAGLQLISQHCDDDRYSFVLARKSA